MLPYQEEILHHEKKRGFIVKSSLDGSKSYQESKHCVSHYLAILPQSFHILSFLGVGDGVCHTLLV